MGGNLPAENVLGNVTPDMRTNVLNVFLAVREFARTRFPHLTGDIRDFDYTYKVTKEDEPSGGSSAGLPTALAFMSVFLQRSVRQDVASSGEIVTDAHDVLVVQNVGDVEHKVRGAYHRNLSTLLLPTGNRHELEQSSLVPRVITEEIVRFIGRLDEALPLAFADASFG
jgi:predicted S18 family serine protease